jgi:hypothetical protein
LEYKVTIKEAFEHLKKVNQNKNPKTIGDYDRYYNKICFDVMRQELKKYVIPVVRE